MVGDLTGVVTGSDGKPLPETVITLTNEESGEKVEAKSDKEGVFVIPLWDKDWKAGKHTIAVTEPGGKTISQTGVQLGDGANRVNLKSGATLAVAKRDFHLSDPITMQTPQTTAGETVGAVAQGLVGGLLGGFLGGGSRRESETPSLPLRPPYPEQPLTSRDGRTKINLSGAADPDSVQFTVGVQESPGNGAPHLIVLQDGKGNVLQPSDITVYEIWEVWAGWRVTVSWTKSYYQDGRLVRQERGGWTASWTEYLGRFKNPADIPAIWRDFGGKPFEGIRGVIADFKFPEGQTFNPAEWNLVAHVTTMEGNMIVTRPFVASMTAGEKGILSFTQRQRTVWETMR